MTTISRSLELYFIDGKPDGMLTAEVFNWTGHVLMSPRTQISEALKRKEASFTGVYILIGEKDGQPLSYIGESEDVGSRLRSHDTQKDWWTDLIIITSSANNLHKAHVKYLESRLVEEANIVGRTPLENGNKPTKSSLSEASQANMEAFLEYLLMVLPALRVDIFLRKTRPKPDTITPKPDNQAPVFILDNTKHKIHATAILENGEFIVQAGSQARLRWEGDLTDKTSYWKLFNELMGQGVLKVAGQTSVFTENYAFSSTSAAGAVVNGRSSRGPTEWKLKSDGRTYRQWEQSQLQLN